MHGTLEVKQEGLTAEAIKRPEWMDEVAADAMTEEQRKVRKAKQVNRACKTLLKLLFVNFFGEELREKAHASLQTLFRASDSCPARSRTLAERVPNERIRNTSFPFRRTWLT